MTGSALLLLFLVRDAGAAAAAEAGSSPAAVWVLLACSSIKEYAQHFANSHPTSLCTRSLATCQTCAKQRHRLVKVSHLAQSFRQKTLSQLLSSLYEANSMQHSDQISCAEKRHCRQKQYWNS